MVPEGAQYAFALMNYDDKGRLVSEEYYDEYDRLAPSRDGFAAHYVSYTESGLVAEEYYLDVRKQPMAIGEFSKRVLVSEDKESQTYVMRIMDETLSEDARIYSLQTFDRYNQPIVIRYLDAQGNAAIGPEGCSMVTREYTSRGQVSLEMYFDADGNALAVDGVYGKTYSAFAKLEKETWLDQNGNPTVTKDGYASKLYDYDLSDSRRVEKYFCYYLDQNDCFCAAQNGAWGISTLYYPVTRVYEVTFLNANGDPLTTTDGYAILEYEADEYGNVVWEGYYDSYHASAICTGGYSSVERGYDGEGRLISERYLDRNNKLTNNSDGVAGWNGYYTPDGELIINNRYDQDRKTVPADNQ